MTQSEILSTWTDDMQTIKVYADNTIGPYNTLQYAAHDAVKKINAGEAVELDTYIKQHIQPIIVVVSNIIRHHNNSGNYHISMSIKDKYICAYQLIYDTITDYI